MPDTHNAPHTPAPLSRRVVLGMAAGGLAAAATAATVAGAGPVAAARRPAGADTPAPAVGRRRKPWRPVISAAQRP